MRFDPSLVNADFEFDKFGIEIISEEDNGFIIGASVDNLKSLEEKISGFANQEYATGKIAQLWEIIAEKPQSWKPKHILSENLYANWSNIEEEKLYNLEVSIAFDIPIRNEPDRSKNRGESRGKKWDAEQIDREEKLLQRQDEFEKFISYYGEVTSSIVELEDSFGCEVMITGIGLKDLVNNYQFVFDVSEVEDISVSNDKIEYIDDFDVELLEPDEDAVEVGVIDSGIMEGHKFLSLAIKQENSKTYLNNDSSADFVKGGGHGTKVAGVILFPDGISKVSSPYKLPCFIRNLRILDENNILKNRYPAALMRKIVEENSDCSIFNLSVSSKVSCRNKHMSTWATIIDQLTFEKDVLFVVSTGNISCNDVNYFLNHENAYPDFLHDSYCRIANPAQSSFALTVGSITHDEFDDENWCSLESKNQVSAFSRIGSGMWGMIKPDVVEYGGGYIVSKNDLNQIRYNNETSIEVVQSTIGGSNAVGFDVGTSFTAPKISHLSALLKQLYPYESINLIRAFIAQGARLPNGLFRNPTTLSIQRYGYGLPSLDRVTKNTEQRVSFYNTGVIKAEEGHIYSLKIPESLRDPGDKNEILIEVTLAYSAKVRRTRQFTKSYLSSWLDWTSSKSGESIEQFRSRSLVTNESYSESESGEVIKWKIRERKDWGEVKEIHRNNSTLQKDWAILKSYDLPEELSFAVRGHKGWDKNKEEIPYAIVVSIESLGAVIPIYESIRLENEVEVRV